MAAVSMVRKSTQVAVGGLAAALCLLLMFLTGLIPFATYALPAAAGVVLVAVVVENGFETALLVYGAVSFLSLFVVPDREAAMMFICFFGHYPILLAKLERLRPRWVQTVVKYLFFNGCVVAGYWAAVQVFGMTYLLEGMEEFGRYALLILLGAGNLLFHIYDKALGRIVVYYVRYFRVRYLGRL